MIVNYKRKYLLSDLIIGSLYLLAGVAGFIFQSNPFSLISNTFFSFAGFFLLGSYFYKQRYQYLKFEEGVLTCHIYGSKNISVMLQEITGIKKFTDEITFLTPHKKLKVSTKLIDKEDLPAFKEFLAALDLEPEKNPFSEPAKKSLI
ncbi:hypothetical protein ACXYMT_09125 [Salinimicrobium sp. CAU 1759]